MATEQTLLSLVETLAIAVDVAMEGGLPFDDVIVAAVAVLEDALTWKRFSPG